MNDKTRLFRWLFRAIGGLLLTGSGLSMAIDAGITKQEGGAWFGYGTIALIVFQSGLCLMIDSVRFRRNI
jgi:hypothetical protein